MNLAIVLFAGTVFGFGLGLSDLMRQEVVLSFLYLDDLGLLLTMGAAIAVAMPAYQLVARRSQPVLGGTFDTFPKSVTRSHITGGGVFGIGLGLAAVCPGAALACLGAGNWPMIVGFAGMLVGAYVQGLAAPSLKPANIRVEDDGTWHRPAVDPG